MNDLVREAAAASCDSPPVGASFLSWKASLDALRVEAIAQTVNDPWGSANAEARALSRQGAGLLGDQKKFAGWVDAARGAARAGRLGVSAGLPPPPERTVYGWRVLLSRFRFPDGHCAWHLSARLHPPGRSATNKDWQRLGQIARHLGAPHDPLHVPDDPTNVHHWRWDEEPAPAQPSQAKLS
jgi:hypothetical protein